MKENKFMPACAVWAGLLLVLAAIVHLSGLNNIVVAIKAGDISDTYARSVLTAWIFSGLGQLLLGFWLMFLSKDLRHRSRRAWWQTLIIAVGLAGASVGSWVLRPGSIHVLFLVLIALILLVPLILFVRQYHTRVKT
jgi:cytochrome bd-type quinol oxidase subunit 2